MANHLFIRSLNRCGQQISILDRDLDTSGYDSSQPVEVFTEIGTPLSIVKTLKNGSKLFDSVQIVQDATHIFCIEYNVAYAGVEFQNSFIDLKNKRFKVLAVTNIDEKDQVLVFQATERGDSSLEANQA